VSTTGNGASPGDFFGGGAADPAQKGPATPPPSARSERRRISERLAEAATTVETGRARGMPSSSPWQRSNAVWHRAGIDWSRAEPGPRPSRPATVPAPRTAPQYPAPVAATGTVPPRAPAEPPALGDQSDPEPWVPPKRPRRLPALPALDGLPVRPPVFAAIAVVAVVVIAAGAYLLSGGGDDAQKKPAASGAVAADRLFTVDPAATTSGRTHTLDAVAASGGTVVAIGSEQGGVYSRGQFLTSGDGGRAWKVATVRAPDGGDPPQGEYPRLLAGGAGSWAALGGIHDGMVEWTSRDARTWTRRPLSGAFGPGDAIKQLTRTASGFVAVGTTTVKDATQAVLWTSADGGSWTRLGGERFAPPKSGTTVGLSQVAAHSDIVVVQGRVRTTETVTKRVKGKKKKVQRTAENEAFWRSPDGGRTWAPVVVPQGQGSSGDVVGVAATQAGFFAAREASSTTGSKKKRTTTHYAAFFSSPDGKNWGVAGRLEAGGYSGIGMMRGTDAGVTVLISVGGGKTAVMTSGDTKAWRHVGDLQGGRTPTGAALTSQGPVVTGRLANGDAYLTIAGGADVALASVFDAVHPERTVDGIVAGPGRVVALGSTNGRAALWTSPDGSAWSRATLPVSKDPGPQRLVDAVHGGPGWLAVGGTGSRPLVLTSGDGSSWAPAPVGAAFDGQVAPSAAAASGSAYVVVGSADGTTAAAWTSADLKTWTRSGNAGKGDLDGARDAPKWMSDVAAGPNGFVAVGGQTTGKTSRPALWTSPDGRRWTLSPSAPALPSGTTQGSLTKVVARGNVLLATGVAGAYVFAAVSADGGRTWQPAALPGAASGTQLTAATSTPRGFVLMGTAGSDVMTWTSPDGRAWRASRPHGLGLDGLGVQRLDGVTVAGTNLLAVGFTGDSRTDGPTLWRTPMP
jgi:hypothetical protein